MHPFAQAPIAVHSEPAISTRARIHAAFVPVEHIGDVIPDTRLVDQNGNALSLRDGALPTIVSFAYTRCPDPTLCSAVTSKFAVLARSLRGTDIRLVEISLDPAYDRPAVLHSYAAAAGAGSDRWSLATGDPKEVLALAQRLGIAFDRTRANALRHSELVAIVASDGTLIDRIDGATWSPGDVAAQTRADAGLSSNPLQRLALRLFASASAVCGGRGGGVTVLAAIALFIVLTTAIAVATMRLCTPATIARPRT